MNGSPYSTSVITHLESDADLVDRQTEDKDYRASDEVFYLARLSDGVFMLAMLVPILAFQMPDVATPSNGPTAHSFLLAQIEPLIGYITSFLVMSIYWIEHRRRFSYYRRTNTAHVWLCLLCLMCTAIVPYSNVLVTHYFDDSKAQLWFSVNVFFRGAFSFLSWIYATRSWQLVAPDLDIKTINANKKVALIEPLFSLLTIVTSFINPMLWLVTWLLVPIPYFLVERSSKESKASD
jgi:uncharacterized membrane protein